MSSLNPLAASLNDVMAAVHPHVCDMLSSLGKELYFPKGILTQTAEAKELAKRFNATIGVAMEDGEAMHIACLMDQLPGVSPNDALLYAPSTGLPDLRKAWKEKNEADNPSMIGRPCSLPVVTCGLTHGLSLVADLFCEPGDTVLLPDKLWGNYRMIFQVRRGAKVRTYEFFKGQGLDLDSFRDRLKKACETDSKVIVLLNFPNNPTGYSPTEAEGRGLADALLEAAKGGRNIVAVLDDAYFGLFYDKDVMKESLFGRLAGAHPRLMAIKADAATKEVFVWGLRVGFLTFSIGGAASDSPVYDALVQKTGGDIRGVISNCSKLSQKLVLDAIKSPQFRGQRAAKVEVMRRRAARVKEVLADQKYADAWTPYPFNSGYFMCLQLKRVDAEKLRRHLLEKYGVGTISIGDRDLRVAFSCLELDQIPQVFDVILQGVNDLTA